MTDELREAMEYGRRRLHQWRLNDPTKIAKELRCIRTLLSRIDALEKSLRPFADAGAYLVLETTGYEADDKLMLTTKDRCGKSHGLIEVLYGAFETARAALDGGEGEKDA